MIVLTTLKQQCRRLLRKLSLYDVAALLVISAFIVLFFFSPMPELSWDAAGQATTGIFWHDAIGNVVLTGRIDGIEGFVAKFLQHYGNFAEVFYTPIFWGLVGGFTFSFFGIGESTYYYTVLFFALVTILATYLLASRLYDKRIGFISNLFLASSHALYGYSKSSTIDIPATAMVTLSMLIFLKAEANRRWVYSLFAGVLVGLSFMTKPTTAIIAVTIVLFLITKYVRSRNRKAEGSSKEGLPKRLSNFAIMSISALVMFAIQMYIWINSGAISSWIYAFLGPPVAPFPWHIYFLWIFTEYFSLIMISLFVIGFVFCLGKRNSSDIFLLTWFVTVLLFAMFASNKQPRYLLPLVPCLSIIASRGLVSLYSMAKERLNIQSRKIPIQYLIKIIFVFLIISGILGNVGLIQGEPHKSLVDFTNINESPMGEVAKFLVEKEGVIYVLPEYGGWVALQVLGAHYSLPTLEFYILKYDRQTLTYFYGSYDPLYGSNETFLESLDQLSDDYGGKTVYVVIPYATNLSWDILEFLEPPLRAFMEIQRINMDAFQKRIEFMDSHSQLIPLVRVFRRGEVEIRVYQRIKGAF